MAIKLEKWKLTHIVPDEDKLFVNLNTWFDTQPLNGSSPLTHYYNYGTKFHPGELASFRRKDRYEGTRWLGHTAKRLFAIHAAVICRGIDVYKTNKVKTFRMLNCKPAGGWWQKDSQTEGFFCHNMLCPWCYLRRFGELFRYMSFDTTRLVDRLSRPAGRDKNGGLGFSQTVNLTLFTAQEEWKDTEASPILQPWAVSSFVSFCDHFVRKGIPYGVKRTVSEFKTGMRFLSPLLEIGPYNRKERDSKPITLVGLRTGYIHTTPFEGLPETEIIKLGEGTVRVTRLTGIPLERAMLLASPYPVRWFDAPDKLVKQMADAFHNRKTYGVVRLVKDKADLQLPCPETELHSIPSV